MGLGLAASIEAHVARRTLLGASATRRKRAATGANTAAPERHVRGGRRRARARAPQVDPHTRSEHEREQASEATCDVGARRRARTQQRRSATCEVSGDEREHRAGQAKCDGARATATCASASLAASIGAHWHVARTQKRRARGGRRPAQTQRDGGMGGSADMRGHGGPEHGERGAGASRLA
jgi:hypothetical protein